MLSKNITKQQLLSLLGHLNFAMRVIPQERSFISRISSTSIKYRSMKGADPTCVSGLICSITGMASLSSMKTWFIPLIPCSSSRMPPSVSFGGFFQGQWFASAGLPPSQDITCRPLYLSGDNIGNANASLSFATTQTSKNLMSVSHAYNRWWFCIIGSHFESC